MNKSQIFSKIESICHQIFGGGIQISEETSSSDIEKWDSMNHVILIASIEKEFGITFDIMEIINITTIGDFVDIVDKKQG
jgi:acyl carrier protein